MDVGSVLNTKKIEREISSIEDDFNYIINELSDISDSLRNNFKGIGSENCADKLNTYKTLYQGKLIDFESTNGLLKSICKGIDSFEPDGGGGC